MSDRTQGHLPQNWPRPSLLVTVGSHAYGLSTPQSDWDYKGFYVAPSEDFWKLKVPNQQFQATGLGPEKDQGGGVGFRALSAAEAAIGDRDGMVSNLAITDELKGTFHEDRK